jgi:hypothetical protein
MKQNRLDIILHRNQQSVLFDLVLAIAFVVAAMTTGLAMKTALGDLAGVPVDTASGTALTTAPCAQLASADPQHDLIAFADSPLSTLSR